MIRLHDLHFSYKKKQVFNGLYLDFSPGHIYGLLGKNGAGKSTLLRIIAGLLYPQNGKITVDTNIPVQRLPSFLQDVFLLPEEFHLPDMPIRKFLKHHAPFYSRFSHEQFEKYCADFDVPQGSTLQGMSYGQKKKVMIAFALATNARYVLMDEPSNGLDIMSKSRFRKVLAEALDEERCMIISTHQVKDLENLIDRITIIDEGKILFDKDIEEISKKLSFHVSFDESETREAFYVEPSLRGNAMVSRNESGEESKLDLELLYKAIMVNGDMIKDVFNPLNQLHESGI
ncbi:ABC transporter ATP-binding protein [Chitinophagaceae bacterium LB-8]|uniref:ABC transporter ATP-binding protein n=1 Tax=Paraflavisolibacter caeni TaxID=2982496 RepID=A0A9X3BEU2_9BACT|nr:ABC transporter ATP-binding protein [Paraflavisolibacter caeni]MCU7547659.1 ABC transporter ATP-binding protein [Paraflavisolibacter caeni]